MMEESKLKTAGIRNFVFKAYCRISFGFGWIIICYIWEYI